MRTTNSSDSNYLNDCGWLHVLLKPLMNLIMHQIVCLSAWFTSFPFPLIVVRPNQIFSCAVHCVLDTSSLGWSDVLYAQYSLSDKLHSYMLLGCVSPGFTYLTLSVMLTVSLSFFVDQFYWFADFFRNRDIPAIYSLIRHSKRHRWYWYSGGTLVIHSGSPSSYPRSNILYTGVDGRNFYKSLPSIQRVIWR